MEIGEASVVFITIQVKITDYARRIGVQVNTMNPKKLLTDDDAVSPVIGVILMVAITVILAAVIASFVLGLGDSTSTTPSASFDFEYNSADGNVTVTHETGDNIDENRLSVVLNGTSKDWPSSATSGDTVSSGTTIVVGQNGDIFASTDLNASSGDTIKIAWNSEDGESSSTLGEYNVPDN